MPATLVEMCTQLVLNLVETLAQDFLALQRDR